MTVGELLAELERLDPHLEVKVRGGGIGCYHHIDTLNREARRFIPGPAGRPGRTAGGCVVIEASRVRPRACCPTPRTLAPSTVGTTQTQSGRRCGYSRRWWRMSADRHPRSATAIRFPEPLHQQLKDASRAFGLPINYLVVKACEEFVDNLIDPSELRLTRHSDA